MKSAGVMSRLTALNRGRAAEHRLPDNCAREFSRPRRANLLEPAARAGYCSGVVGERKLMNFQTGRNHLPLAALCLVILLLGTQRSPAPISPLILVTPVPTNGIAALPVLFNAASVAQPGSHVITN